MFFDASVAGAPEVVAIQPLADGVPALPPHRGSSITSLRMNCKKQPPP